MTTSIASVVARFKDDPEQHLDHRLVLETCVDVDHSWRDRVLNPTTTLRLFVLQVLHGNVACRALRHLSGINVSATAYCKARRRLPVELFRCVVARVTDRARQYTREFGRWFGHRVFLLDGSGLSMPDDSSLQRAFGQPKQAKKGCGFPVMHVLWMFDAATGLLVDLVSGGCNRPDIVDVPKVHAKLRPGDVMIGDRAFCSYAHLALILKHQLHTVMRMHQRRIVKFRHGRRNRDQWRKSKRPHRSTSRFVKKLDLMDQLVEYAKPKERPSWVSREDFLALPEAIMVRELRYRIRQQGFRTRQVTLVTTLLDPDRYPKEELAKLYQSRWQIETNLCHLKQTMGMDVLHCKTPDGVLKELWVFVLVYNQIRLLMLEAARRQKVDPDRVSFIDARDCLRHRPPETPMPVLIVNPKRPNRDEPRVIKRPKDCYTYMTQPRHKLRQALGIKHIAA